jgi:hypothetical protein
VPEHVAETGIRVKSRPPLMVPASSLSGPIFAGIIHRGRNGTLHAGAKGGQPSRGIAAMLRNRPHVPATPQLFQAIEARVYLPWAGQWLSLRVGLPPDACCGIHDDVVDTLGLGEHGHMA